VDRMKLVRETMETTTDYSGRTAEFIESLAAKIQAGKIPGPAEWEDLFKALQWLAEACSVLAADASLLPADRAVLKSFVTGLPSILQEIARAQELGDPVFLGDLLGYELAGKVADLQQSLLLTGMKGAGGNHERGDS